MTRRRVLASAAAAAVTAAMLAGAGSAAATTFCVPGFHSACPNSGGNVAQASLETAMKTNGDDTVPDLIVIAAGTITNPDPYELDSGDNDDLEIVGAGPEATAVTTTGSGNEFVMNLNGARDVTVRDLTLRAPASFTDNQGGALQAEEDAFVNVDLESRNVRSDGANSMIGGSTFVDGRVYGSNGGSIDTGFATNGAGTGELRIERTTIEDASWGVAVDDAEVVTRIRRTRIVDPLAYGLRVTTGGFAVMENSLVFVDDGYAISAETGSTETLIFTVRHSTIVDTGGDEDPVIDVGDSGTPAAGSLNGVISDTIVAGNEDPLNCDSPMSSTTLTMRYSYFFHSATVKGKCSLPTVQTIDAFDPEVGPPQFAGPGDYRLPAGSPAIDSGDPLTVTLPTEDFDGAPRPVDGDGDGDAEAAGSRPPLAVLANGTPSVQLARAVGEEPPRGSRRGMLEAEFHHVALFYEDDEEFLAGTVPRLRESLEAGQIPLVAVRPSRAALLEDELGDDAEAVEFVNVESLGCNPARLVPLWQEFLDGALDPAPLLGIGEPAWPGRSAAELEECRRHEALLDAVFADGLAWTLLCPYDSAGLDDEVLISASEAHSGAEAGPPTPFAGTLPDPPAGPSLLRFSHDGLGDTRELASREAAGAGLSGERATDLVLAVNELAANSVSHGGGSGTLRIWRERDALVAEVRDGGRIEDPLAGRRRPGLAQESGRGLWIVNQLCDLVQIRSGEAGTAVRLRMALG
jgi:anti-sigma regulatory factor (Ser/Thr protein kinase)